MSQSLSHGTIVFAQLDRFSYTNDAISAQLPKSLDNKYKIEGIRVYRKIVDNYFYLGLCLISTIIYYGPFSIFNRRQMNERIFKNPFFFVLASWYLRRYLRNIPDLVAVFQTQCLFSAKLPDVPLIIYADNTILNTINGVIESNLRNNQSIRMEKKTYEIASCLTASSGHVAQSMISDYGLPAEKIRVVHIGANVDDSPDLDPGRFTSGRILFIGIDWERKGGPELVEAFSSLLERFPHAHLTIVGAKPDLVHPNITVLGRIPLGEVSKLIARSAIFCMPSRQEPMGIAPIEAARLGLPVVATNTGGLPDSVVDQKTGFLVPVEDAPALAEALAKLLADPDLAEALGRAGRAHVERFTWPMVCEKIAECIHFSLEDHQELSVSGTPLSKMPSGNISIQAILSLAPALEFQPPGNARPGQPEDPHDRRL